MAWQWTLIRQPAGSSAKLSGQTERNPTFTPDVADLYIFRLRATNAAGAFCIRTVSLTATNQPIVFSAPQMGTNGQFGFTLLSQPGATVEIQTSPDLSSWTALATVTNVTGTVLFVDLSSAVDQRESTSLREKS